MKSNQTIVVDSREKNAIQFPPNVKTVVKGLYSGDYSALGLEHLISIEKKDIDDLCGSLTTGRERFERELHRLRGFRFKRLLIIGHRSDIIAGNYRSRATPKSILASLCAFEVRYDIPVVFANEKVASELVIRWCFWFSREITKNAQNMENAQDEGEPHKG